MRGLFRGGLVLVVSVQLFALGAIWAWAVHGMSRQVGTACTVSWLAVSCVGFVMTLVGVE